jgi:hypothetical protein
VDVTLSIDLGFFLELQPLHEKVKGVCVYGGGGGACGDFVVVWISLKHCLENWRSIYLDLG